MKQLKTSRRFKQPLVLGLLLLSLTGCATPSTVYKTQYVPVDNPRPICVYKIEDSFKENVYLNVNNLPDVATDDDVELLAKTAMDDIVNQDIAFDKLVDEVNSAEQKCVQAEKDAQTERQTTLDKLDELNEPKP